MTEYHIRVFIEYGNHYYYKAYIDKATWPILEDTPTSLDQITEHITDELKSSLIEATLKGLYAHNNPNRIHS